MTRLELARPRDISALFADALGVYRRNAGTFLVLSAAVVVPVHLIVEGVGMEKLTSGFDSSPSAAETIIPSLVRFLVVAPLITAVCIHALHMVAAGERPRSREAILEGLESFAPIFFAVLLAGIGIALGLVLLVLPGIYIAVRWYFVPQAVVVEGARPPPPSSTPPSSCAGRGGARSASLSWPTWPRCCQACCSSPPSASLPGAPTARSGRSWGPWPPRRSPGPRSWRSSRPCSITTCAPAGARALS